MPKNEDKFFNEKNIDKLLNKGYTNFLDGKKLKLITQYLNKNKIKYNIYEPFINSDYKIIYQKKIPNITCFQIITQYNLAHKDIMGAIYNFNINEDLIGDIIINNGYYFIVLDEIKDYFLNNFNQISKYQIKLKEVDIPLYEKEFIDLKLIVSSLRIDNVISKLINLKRDDISLLISRKEVILNYDILTNRSYNLKENDIFSIRRYGKYKYIEVIKKTKKDNYIILLKKYT